MTLESYILQDIPDEKPVNILLPVKGSNQHYQADCIYRIAQPPEFQLIFPTGILPADSLDLKNICIMTVHMGEHTLSLEAKIRKVENNRSLQLIVHKKNRHAQMRDFFRVDATIKIISNSFHSGSFGKDNTPWRLQGKTIDISGSGLLASFVEEHPKDDQVWLEIMLPANPPDTIKVRAHPVRITKVSDNQWNVAYQFDDIDDKDRDKIIGCCLVIQRRLLRHKIRIPDQDKI